MAALLPAVVPTFPAGQQASCGTDAWCGVL